MTSEEYDKLTDVERIARIAKLCGWTALVLKNAFECTAGVYGTAPNAEPIKQNRHQKCPDYLNNLNAMHVAEELIVGTDKWDTYATLLADGDITHLVFVWNGTLHATAAQRARAFVLTMTGDES